MKIILLKDVQKVGKKYETKDVSDGFALNSLIPRGLAIAATPDVVKRIGLEKAKIEGERKVHEELLRENMKKLESTTLTMSGKANDKGHLFASFHAGELAAELSKQAHIQIDPSFIKLKSPLKAIGEHIVEVEAEGKKGKFKVVIQAK